jgi:hypothetical protein
MMTPRRGIERDAARGMLRSFGSPRIDMFQQAAQSPVQSREVPSDPNADAASKGRMGHKGIGPEETRPGTIERFQSRVIPAHQTGSIAMRNLQRESV